MSITQQHRQDSEVGSKSACRATCAANTSGAVQHQIEHYGPQGTMQGNTLLPPTPMIGNQWTKPLNNTIKQLWGNGNPSPVAGNGNNPMFPKILIKRLRLYGLHADFQCAPRIWLDLACVGCVGSFHALLVFVLALWGVCVWYFVCVYVNGCWCVCLIV